MPTIICLFCQYVGQGDEMMDRWQDANAHELKEHPKEHREHYGEFEVSI